MRRRAVLILSVMVAALVVASGTALAVNKVCLPSTPEDPCLGTKKTKAASGNDLLIGTSEDDYISALSGNDKIAAGEGNDTTNGGTGNDTYSYADGWGNDTLVDASGVDALNFSAMSNGIIATLLPEWGITTDNSVSNSEGGSVTVSINPLSVIEKVVGSARGFDRITTGGAANILQPGPGAGGASLKDAGGYLGIPVSDDTYSGFLASGYGTVSIVDYGGTADKLILPFASTDAYFAAYNDDDDANADTLIIMSTNTDNVTISGQLDPDSDQQGHIETIQFTDGNLSIGSASTSATSASSTASSSDSPTSQVDALNAASTLSASKKDELAKAAKKIAAKAK